MHVKNEDEVNDRYIIREWEEKRLVEKKVVNICVSHPSENRTLDSWCGISGKYNIHQWHKKFGCYADAAHIGLWNSLEDECFPSEYDFTTLKSRVNEFFLLYLTL